MRLKRVYATTARYTKGIIDLFSVPAGTVPQIDPEHGVDGGARLPAGNMNPDERECLSTLVQNLRNKEALRKLAGKDIPAR